MLARMVMPRLSNRFCCVTFTFVACCSAQAAGIRQFSISTIERLGRELYEQTQRTQSLSEPQKRAKRAAMAAVPELEKQGYRFYVLNDPEAKAWLGCSAYRVGALWSACDFDRRSGRPLHEALRMASASLPRAVVAHARMTRKHLTNRWSQPSTLGINVRIDRELTTKCWVAYLDLVRC